MLDLNRDLDQPLGHCQVDSEASNYNEAELLEGFCGKTDGIQLLGTNRDAIRCDRYYPPEMMSLSLGSDVVKCDESTRLISQRRL